MTTSRTLVQHWPDIESLLSHHHDARLYCQCNTGSGVIVGTEATFVGSKKFVGFFSGAHVLFFTRDFSLVFLHDSLLNDLLYTMMDITLFLSLRCSSFR